MKRATKARYLAARIREASAEVQHCYRIIRTNIKPEANSESAAHRATAMKQIAVASAALEEAARFVEEIV